MQLNRQLERQVFFTPSSEVVTKSAKVIATNVDKHKGKSTNNKASSNNYYDDEDKNEGDGDGEDEDDESEEGEEEGEGEGEGEGEDEEGEGAEGEGEREGENEDDKSDSGVDLQEKASALPGDTRRSREGRACRSGLNANPYLRSKRWPTLGAQASAISTYHVLPGVIDLRRH